MSIDQKPKRRGRPQKLKRLSRLGDPLHPKLRTEFRVLIRELARAYGADHADVVEAARQLPTAYGSREGKIDDDVVREAAREVLESGRRRHTVAKEFAERPEVKGNSLDAKARNLAGKIKTLLEGPPWLVARQLWPEGDESDGDEPVDPVPDGRFGIAQAVVDHLRSEQRLSPQGPRLRGQHEVHEKMRLRIIRRRLLKMIRLRSAPRTC
jgi:hypothetical protein